MPLLWRLSEEPGSVPKPVGGGAAGAKLSVPAQTGTGVFGGGRQREAATGKEEGRRVGQGGWAGELSLLRGAQHRLLSTDFSGPH